MSTKRSDTHSYQLLDSGDGQKLEQVGPWRLVRPSAQAIWRPTQKKLWHDADAVFVRKNEQSGYWNFRRKIPDSWQIRIAETKLWIKLTQFGHLGIFPEHHKDHGEVLLKKDKLRILNLFAYTGYVSIAAAQAGHRVVHCDSSRSSVAWAKDNATLTGAPQTIRWITDDVTKFVARELRRGSRYDGFVLDPPSYGRGPKGEVWKIEDDLPKLLCQLRDLSSEKLSFVKLSSHSAGFSPIVLGNLLRDVWGTDATTLEGEMSIKDSSGRLLPCGAYALWTSENRAILMS